eukprot:7002132-Pyramimonas_sp.AAC.1
MPGEIFPFGDVGAPQYVPSDSVNITSKEFVSWLGERHDDRPAWADRRCTTVPRQGGHLRDGA